MQQRLQTANGIVVWREAGGDTIKIAFAVYRAVEEDGALAAAVLDIDTPLDGSMAACENVCIRAALLQHQGHLAETAHASCNSRKSLWETMRKHAMAAEPSH